MRTYEDLTEGFYGNTFLHQGVKYRDINQVTGFFPDGSPMTPDDVGTTVTVEDATAFYADFPTYGSPVNSLTFGSAFINGPNVSIGAIASVWMDLDEPASAVEFDLGYYEKGPWGGIVYHLDALLGGQVVASEMFTIASGIGRDNATWRPMSVTAAAFDQLHLYATFNGNFTGPRGMIDNLTLTAVPEPASAGLVIGLLAAARRRRI